MNTVTIVLEFAVMFAVVFGLSVAVARRRAAVRKARQERLAEEERKRQVMQAKSDDIWRANKRLKMH